MTVKQYPDILRFFVEILSLNVRLHLFTYENERLLYCPFAFMLGAWKWSLGFHYGLDSRRDGQRGSSLRMWFGSLVDFEYFIKGDCRYGHMKIGRYRKRFDKTKDEHGKWLNRVQRDKKTGGF